MQLKRCPKKYKVESDKIIPKSPCFRQPHYWGCHNQKDELWSTLMKPPIAPSLEAELHQILEMAERGPLSIKDLLQCLSGRGFPLLLMLLSIPFCQPLQIPGLSTPFGLSIAFIGLRGVFGKQIWLPQKILNYSISSHHLKKIGNTLLSLAKKLKKWIHPRLTFLCDSTWAKPHGFIFFILGLLLSLPLPIPFSNLLAAWAIFLIALGLIEDDGLWVIMGYLLLLSTVCFLSWTTWWLIK